MTERGASMAQKKSVFKDETIVGSPIRQYITLSVVLFAFWCLLCWNFTAKFVFVGAASSLIAAYVCMPLLLLENKSGTKKYFAFDVNLLEYALYWLWLLNEVRKANMDVATSITRADMRINPKVFKFKMPFDNPMACATLANSITLTPGTITVNVTEDGVYTIHALTDGAREGLIEGGMQEKIAKLFGEEFDYVAEEYVEEGEV